MHKINKEVNSFFNHELANWSLARANYEGLKTVRTKSFSFGDYEVRVQFNPARIVSSGAKVDAKTIAERKCFLCAENRPAEQTSVGFGDYEILVNPFPIFPEHFTIAHKKHQSQQIMPHFADMLRLAQALDDYLVFYNGPQCGASAPDHLHFQAGTKNFLPLVNDYKQLKEKNAELMNENNNARIFQLKNYGRTVFVIESTDIESAENAFKNLSLTLSKEEGTEKMMNIVCTFELSKWNIFVLPRKAFRPWQYTAEGDEQLLISPATVEMSGIFITPLEAHFNKTSKEDIVSIFEQVSI
jgi:ATP adenylyltransferase/5',5'''-P-1,P-4-tetraphosphate phosphorylase II